MVLYLWSSLYLSAVGAVLLSMASANTEDCTPTGQQVIQCMRHNSTDACDETAAITASGPSLPVVIDLSAKTFMASSGYTGVVISWKAPNPAALNATVGYVLRLYYLDQADVKTQQLCRYHKVWSLARRVEWRNLGVVFSFTVPALERKDANMVAEVATLPTTPHPAPTPSVTFTTYKSLSYKYPINITFDVSTPYSVTAGFRRTSYYDDIDVLYNHTYYKVYLWDKGEAYTRNFLNKEIQAVNFDRSKIEEYATLTYTHLMPATYVFEVRPFKLATKACIRCRNETDIYQAKRAWVTVLGADYKPPNQPQIYISDFNAVTVTFAAAPSSHFVQSYNVSLSTPDGPSLISQKVPPANSSDWHTENVSFTSEEVSSHFAVRDRVQATVIPTIISALCKEPGKCNLDGSCTPCAKSFSHSVTVKRRPVNIDVIVAATTTTAIVVIIAMLVLCMWRRGCPDCLQQLVKRAEKTQPTVSDNKEVVPSDSRSAFTFGDGLSQITDEASRMFLGPDLITITIAFAASEATSPHYEKLVVTLTDIFSRFFSCRVVPYTEICRRGSNLLSQCQFLLVLCSSELCAFNEYLSRMKQPPATVRQEWMQYFRVREQLRRDIPTPILATFPHIRSKYTEELQTSSGSRVGDVYSLPDQFERLAAGLYSNDSTNTKITTWTEYKRSSLSTRLASEIQELVAACKKSPSMSLPVDSGLGDTMSLQSVSTVTTLDQLRRLHSDEGCATNTPPTQPLLPQWSAVGSPERKDTTSPQALEMYYLRQTSDDLNHNRQHSQQQRRDSPPSTDPQQLPNYLPHQILHNAQPQQSHNPYPPHPSHLPYAPHPPHPVVTDHTPRPHRPQDTSYVPAPLNPQNIPYSPPNSQLTPYTPSLTLHNTNYNPALPHPQDITYKLTSSHPQDTNYKLTPPHLQDTICNLTPPHPQHTPPLVEEDESCYSVCDSLEPRSTTEV